MKRQLIVTAGPEQGRSFALAEGQAITIGRGQASDTRIDDPHMSRVHCRLETQGGQTVLIDAGGAGGTRVNGEPVTECTLQPGDVIQAGGTQLRYQVAGAEDPSTHMFGRPKPPPSQPSLKNLVGQSLAHYRLDAIIARGNTSMVFRATDTQQNRPVAVKVLDPEATKSEDEKQRFVRAMKTMLPIRHENIVQLYHAGKNGPYCWAAMQFVEGENLAQVIDRLGSAGRLDWREVYNVAVQIAKALEEAFQRKIIHRNLTPTNILRRQADKVCLVGDLMLAKALQGTLAQQITQPGQLIGDVPYMSPERTRDGAPVDWRSDQYGLGATLYALLTGRAPFTGNSLPELIRLVRERDAVPPRTMQAEIDAAFEALVLKMMAKDPDQRFQSVSMLLYELGQIGQAKDVTSGWDDWAG